jgi:ABC-type transport system involved in cytochrome bd biosynthesis fused ATPase/permease subunit
MSGNAQENEFVLFGFIDKRMRAGIMVGFLVLSLMTNAYQYNLQQRTNDRIIAMQADLYKQMLDRVDKTVNEKLDQPVRQINESVKKVNSSTTRVDSIADRASDVTRQLENKIKSKP